MSFFFLATGIWVWKIEEPGSLGPSFTITISSLCHLGRYISPPRKSGPFPVCRNGNRTQRVPAAHTSCNFFQNCVPSTSQEPFHPFLFAAPRPLTSPRSLLCSTELLNMSSGIRQIWAQKQSPTHLLAEWLWANLCFLICEIRVVPPCRATGRIKQFKTGQSDYLLAGLTSGNAITTHISPLHCYTHRACASMNYWP